MSSLWVPKGRSPRLDGLTSTKRLIAVASSRSSPCQLCIPRLHARPCGRPSSTTTRWKQRQASDKYARDARAQQYRSRAAYKLVEINSRFNIFRKGQTVVDLGYAPGSWSQVAASLTQPGGYVLGIDILPGSQPPVGVKAIQGDFLSPAVQVLVKRLVMEAASARDQDGNGENEKKRHMPVDVVLSDMMMNTSGTPFRDHAGSMDLCTAALQFADETLRGGGHFVTKFYQGPEDKVLESRLRSLFKAVYRVKPDASRKESNEAYFVALRRIEGASLAQVT